MVAGEALNLNQANPLWIGAWWVGFVIAWLLAWVGSLFIGCFPAVLPGAGHHNQIHADEAYRGIKDMPVAIGKLLKNPTYMFINVGSAMDGFAIAGLSTFLPK